MQLTNAPSGDTVAAIRGDPPRERVEPVDGHGVVDRGARRLARVGLASVVDAQFYPESLDALDQCNRGLVGKDAARAEIELRAHQRRDSVPSVAA